MECSRRSQVGVRGITSSFMSTDAGCVADATRPSTPSSGTGVGETTPRSALRRGVDVCQQRPPRARRGGEPADLGDELSSGRERSARVDGTMQRSRPVQPARMHPAWKRGALAGRWPVKPSN